MILPWHRASPSSCCGHSHMQLWAAAPSAPMRQRALRAHRPGVVAGRAREALAAAAAAQGCPWLGCRIARPPSAPPPRLSAPTQPRATRRCQRGAHPPAAAGQQTCCCAQGDRYRRGAGRGRRQQAVRCLHGAAQVRPARRACTAGPVLHGCTLLASAAHSLACSICALVVGGLRPCRSSCWHCDWTCTLQGLAPAAAAAAAWLLRAW